MSSSWRRELSSLGFLEEYASDPSSRLGTEKALAIARLILTVAAMVAIAVDPAEPRRLPALVYALLAAYGAWSVGALLYLKLRLPSPAFATTMQAVTVGWAAAINILTEGPGSIFFSFYLFAVLGAAFRWRLRRTLVTGGVAILLLSLQALISVAGPAALRANVDFSLLIIRITFLSLLTIFAGYLGDRERDLVAQHRALSHLLRLMSLCTGFTNVATEWMEWVRFKFGAVRVLATTRRLETGDCFELFAENAGFYTWRRLDAAEIERFWAPLPASAVAISHGRPDIFIAESDEAAQRIPVTDAPTAAWICAACRTAPERARPESPDFSQGLIVAELSGVQGWEARLFIVDPVFGLRQPRELRFVRRMADHVRPALINSWLVSRFRDHIGALERSRLAHEIHDGPIQVLSGIELLVSTLGAEQGLRPELKLEMSHLQQTIHEETMRMRELMERIRPLSVRSRELPAIVSSLVEDYGRRAGIAVQLAMDLNGPPLPPRVSEELLRLLQEALVNVRKHSHASEALVRLDSRNGNARLVVSDNGIGYPFNGEFTLEKLEALGKGPKTICGRVRALDGDLTLASYPGEGSRLEIVIPLRARSAKV
jgi:signal transduction histidine kinase